MSIKNTIRKISIWFWTRKQIMDEVQSLTEMLDIQMSKYMSNIEALDQDKVYIVYAGEQANYKEIRAFQDTLELYQKRIKWTLPHIIAINRPIKALTKEELKLVAKEIGANNVRTHNK